MRGWLGMVFVSKHFFFFFQMNTRFISETACETISNYHVSHFLWMASFLSFWNLKTGAERMYISFNTNTLPQSYHVFRKFSLFSLLVFCSHACFLLSVCLVVLGKLYWLECYLKDTWKLLSSWWVFNHISNYFDLI